LYGVAFGNNTFVASGQNGKIVRSTDNGSSFDNVTTGISRNLYTGVAFGNNTFVTNYDGSVMRSIDNGTTWTVGIEVRNSVGQPFRGIIFGNNRFVMVGSSGNVVISNDNGTIWDNATIPTGLSGASLMRVTFSE